MTIDQITVGDKVKLLSGSPSMLVIEVNVETSQVHCQWSRPSGLRVDDWFAPELLELL